MYMKQRIKDAVTQCRCNWALGRVHSSLTNHNYIPTFFTHTHTQIRHTHDSRKAASELHHTEREKLEDAAAKAYENAKTLQTAAGNSLYVYTAMHISATVNGVKVILQLQRHDVQCCMFAWWLSKCTGLVGPTSLTAAVVEYWCVAETNACNDNKWRVILANVNICIS